MQIADLLRIPPETSRRQRADSTVVLITRLRLARNLASLPFPGWAKAGQRNDILAACQHAAQRVPQLRNGLHVSLSDLSDTERKILFERHLISKELSESRGAGVSISRDQSVSVMINEEDHIRLQVLRRGFDLKKSWNTATEIDDELEKHLDFAFHPQLGYLTSCPTNVGTGMRASAMMHLPGLVLAGHMEKVVRALNQVGIVVRGFFGEGSEASGSMFQISNQHTLGLAEPDILKKLSKFFNSIIEQELNARQVLLEKEHTKTCDKISRAYGILAHARLLNTAEAMNLLSLLRLASEVGFYPAQTVETLDRLLIEAQPNHIEHAVGRSIEPNQRDFFRAGLLREQVSRLPALDFSAGDA